MTGILAALAPGTHRAGTLSTQVLSSLLNLLPEREICSIETGCGKSTVFFSNLSSQHTSFCYDDRDMADSSVRYVQSHSHYIAARCDFVFGPTQTTLPSHDFTKGPPIDLALIDGPHGFPFPELEYWHIYPHLAPGALLVIDDLMIPSIGRMYDVLREDRMFNEVAVFSTTGVLQRTTEPAVLPTGDHWWEQAYNFRRFPTAMQRYKREFDYEIDSVALFLDERTFNRHCLRGFDFIRHKGAATIDTSAVIRFSCDAPGRKHLAMRMRVQIDNPHACRDAAVFANGRHVADFPARLREFEFAFSCPVSIDGTYLVELRMPGARPIHDRTSALDFTRDCCTVAWFAASVGANLGFPTEILTIREADAVPSDIEQGQDAASEPGSRQLTVPGFVMKLQRLSRIAGDDDELNSARETVPAPVLCPNDTSVVRFMPLVGTRFPEGTKAFEQLFSRSKKSWTYVDLFAFDGVDFPYAVFRSLLLRSPSYKEINAGCTDDPSRRLFLLLEADHKARKLSDSGKVSGFGFARFLFNLWRVCDRMKLSVVAAGMKRIIGKYAVRRRRRLRRQLAERRLLLNALNTLAGRQ